METEVHQPKISVHSKSEDVTICTARKVLNDLITKVETSQTENGIVTVADQQDLRKTRELYNHENKQESWKGSDKDMNRNTSGQPDVGVRRQLCYEKDPKGMLRNTEYQIGPTFELTVLSVEAEYTQPKICGYPDSENDRLCIVNEVLCDLISKMDISCSENDIATVTDQADLSKTGKLIKCEDKQASFKERNEYMLGNSIGQPDLSVRRQTCYEKNEEDVLRSTKCNINPIPGLNAMNVREEQTQSKIPRHSESEAETHCILNEVLDDLTTKVENLCTEYDIGTLENKPDLSKIKELVNREEKQVSLKRSDKDMNRNNTWHPDLSVRRQLWNETNQEVVLSNLECQDGPMPVLPVLTFKAEQTQSKYLRRPELKDDTLCIVNGVVHDLITEVDILCTENNNTGMIAEPLDVGKSEGFIDNEKKRTRLQQNDENMIGFSSVQPDICIKEEQVPNIKKQAGFLNNTEGKTVSISVQSGLDVSEDQIHYENSQEDLLSTMQSNISSSEQSPLELPAPDLAVEREVENNILNLERILLDLPELNEEFEDSVENEDYADVIEMCCVRESPLVIEGISEEGNSDEFEMYSDPNEDDEESDMAENEEDDSLEEVLEFLRLWDMVLRERDFRREALGAGDVSFHVHNHADADTDDDTDDEIM